jgi:hypothetical protein
MRANRAASCWLALTILYASTPGAEAADRTVCFHLQLRDDRNNCPASGTTGALRPCNPGGYADGVGHQIELWDKDTASADEKVGTWYVGGSGRQCVTFAWEGAAYHNGEADPDLYIRYINLVNRTGYSNYIHVRAVQNDGSAHNGTTWRNGESGDPDLFVARNCTAGGACDIFPSGSLVATNDPASPRALRIMALDTAQHALQVFGELMDTHVDMRFPSTSDCTGSCAPDRNLIRVVEGDGNHGSNVAHEVGHAVQMQEFDQDQLQNDCSLGGSTHWMDSIEHESCATTEGFADYAAVASWYEPNNAGTVPMGWGWDFETATPASSSCTDAAHMEIQVAKSFWDFDDWNNEAGAGAAAGWDDRLAYATSDIVRGWREFPDGTDNQQNDENDSDGVNIRDYWVNNEQRFTATGAFETLVRHNCLSAQTDG